MVNSYPRLSYLLHGCHIKHLDFCEPSMISLWSWRRILVNEKSVGILVPIHWLLFLVSLLRTSCSIVLRTVRDFNILPWTSLSISYCSTTYPRLRFPPRIISRVTFPSSCLFFFINGWSSNLPSLFASWFSWNFSLARTCITSLKFYVPNFSPLRVEINRIKPVFWFHD